MKKYFRIIFLLSFICVLAGCNKSNEKTLMPEQDITNTKCSINSQDFFENYSIDSFVCPELSDIAYSGSGFFVNNKGELYEISSKLYSTTNTNCKKVDTEIVFDNVIKNTLISTEGNFYSFYDSELKKISNEQIEKGRAWYGIDQMEIKLYKLNNNISYFAKLEIEAPEIYVYNKGNELYQITYDYNTKTANEELLYTFKDGEKIISRTDGYIITNKNYYKYGKINEDKCSKYEDVECEYGLVIVDSAENCANEIIYISDKITVTKEMLNNTKG